MKKKTKPKSVIDTDRHTIKIVIRQTKDESET